MPTFDVLTRARHRAPVLLRRLHRDQREAASRPGTEFRTLDLHELVRRLEASDCFCRDTRIGRMYHPRAVSFREISPTDSLHVTLDEDGRVAAHLDHRSPLSRRQPGGACRYSPLRIAAHNVSGAAADIVRLALGRPDRRNLERAPVDHEDLIDTVHAKSSAAYPGAMERTYSVPGVSCDHCKRAIEGEVGAVAAVEGVNVDVADKTVRVTGDADDVAVRAAIEEAGYEVAAG